MTNIKILVAGVVIMGMTPAAHAEELKLTREQEVEFNTRHASFSLKQMLKQEMAIAEFPQKDIAVFAAAAAINRAGMAKKESGELNQQQLTFVFSAVLYRLAILAQTANMSPAIVACHVAEARNLENMSKGKPPEMPNCRTDAYGPDIQSEALRVSSKPTWAQQNELVTKWVVNAFTYAEAIGKISMYGAAPTPKIEPEKPRDPKSNVSMIDMYKKADDRGKVAICAPILWKYGNLKGLGMQLEITEKAKQYSFGEFEFLKQISVNSELLKASAIQFSKQAYDQAWKDSANDPILLSGRGFGDFAKMCSEYTESLSKKGWFLPSEKINAENIAVRFVQEVRHGKPTKQP